MYFPPFRFLRPSEAKILSSAPYSWTPSMYEGWNFNSGNFLFTTDTK